MAIPAGREMAPGALAQHANGPEVLSARPCGFSCRARCQWASFRKISGSHSSAIRHRTTCTARPVGVSRVARGAPSQRRIKRQLDQDQETDPLGSRVPVSSEAVEQLRSLSWWLNMGIISIVALLAANELVVSLNVTPDLHPLQAVQQSMASVWDLYAAPVSSSPIFTKATISGITFFLADLSAQSQEGRDFATLDVKRTLRCALVGLLLHGPMFHVFFEKLDRQLIISKYFRGGDAWFAPLMKVVVDQTAWAAAWNIIYLLAIGLLNGKGPGRIAGSIGSSAGMLVKSGWRLWPLAHLITYTAIPLQHRVLWVDVVELTWASVLSMHGSHERQRGIAQAQETLPTPAPQSSRPAMHMRGRMQ